jgi:tetratricopeptide (TPR) repeat protein
LFSNIKKPILGLFRKGRPRTSLVSLGGELKCPLSGGLIMNSLYRCLPILVLGFVMVVSAGPGCGPTKEEIRADEEERLQEEARQKAQEEAAKQERLAEKARLERARAAEAAGDEAARQGQLESALQHYQEVLRNVARYSDQDQRVRRAIIKVVQAMPTPPAVPESALRGRMEGETILKKGGTESYEAASKEMEQAVLSAPWWADGYSSLGILREKEGKYSEALQNLRLYLLAAPQSSGARSVEAKIDELEVMKEEQVKAQLTQGSWRSVPDNVEYRVAIEDGKLRADAKTEVRRKKYSIEVEMKGRTLEGFVHIPSYVDSPCDIPEETDPVSGTLSEDGRSILFRFTRSIYKKLVKYENFFQSSAEVPCVGVTAVGKEEQTVKLIKQSILFLK